MRGSTQRLSAWKRLVFPPATNVKRTCCQPGGAAGLNVHRVREGPDALGVAVELAGVLRRRPNAVLPIGDIEEHAFRAREVADVQPRGRIDVMHIAGLVACAVLGRSSTPPSVPSGCVVCT